MTPIEIITARKQLGLSQADLADALGLAPITGRRAVGKWEKGSVPISGPAALAIRYMLAYGILRPGEQVMDRFGTRTPENA